MSFRERRRSTPLPAGSNAEQTNVDFQSATEAMKRAADAMIAATESFRQQFHQQDINIMPGHIPQGSDGSGSGSGASGGSGSGSGSGSHTAPRAPSAASQRTTSSRRRPVSYQPYRPPSADAALHSPSTPLVPTTRPPSAVSARNGLSSQTGAVTHAYPPPVQRREMSTRAMPTTPATTTSSPRGAGTSPYNNPYSVYRATRASTGSPAPPISMHNKGAATGAVASATAVPRTSSLVPMSEFYTVQPDSQPSQHDQLINTVPRDDSGIAMGASTAPIMAYSVPASNPTSLNSNQTLRMVEMAGPLAMHPLHMDPQQPPRVLQQIAQHEQQAQQQRQQQKQQQQLSQNEAAADDIGSSPGSRASHASWSLMPKIKTAEAPPSRRLTSPVLPPGGGGGPIGAAVSHSPTGGRRPSMSSYVDLIEAASRLKRTHSYQGGGHAGEMIPRDASFTPVTQGGVTDGEAEAGAEVEAEPEPEPILQIGRYTYVRSEAGDHDYRASLIRDDGSRRYTALPVSPAGMGGGGYRRSSLKKAPSKTKTKPKSSMGPYGFSLMHESLFVLLICLSQVLMLAGIAQALIPARIMSLSFPDSSPGNIAWYTASYGLTSGTFVLPAGRLGDLFGHRRVFVVGFVWFAAWSLLAGFTPMIQHATGNPATSHTGATLFIVCRAMQGIGPAMLVPNGQAMLGRAYPPGPRKNIVMSLFGASSPLGFVVGAVMSALFAIYASWPWAFWTMAAVCVALGAVSLLILPADEPRAAVAIQPTDDTTQMDEDADDMVLNKLPPKRESLWVRMDGMGMLLGVAGLVLVNFAFNQAPIVGWATPYTYFLLILGLFFVAAFLYVEAFQAAYPLVPLAAMRSTTNFVLACTATGWGCFSVWVYYVVQMLENLRGWSPLMTSAAFAPAPVTGLIASLLTGFLFSRGVKPHWVMLISMFAFFVGSLLFATSAPGQLYWYNPFFSILIMPFGMDMSNPAAIILVSNSVRREHQGIAASLVVTFVNYAISLALGIAGSVEAGVFDANDLLVGYRAAQYFGLGLGGLGVLFGTTFLCQSYLRAPPAPLNDKA
ncbi:hypothetical protein SCUCBS95973_001987 [Sporothrix curviconia]|uniref:Major facilitator superfamily (MFS) profile domain-containing protein n=1 Tax=Sporothrix curviconia TaxID=1260050 RepID=A0ABP0B371_9PEZI